MRSNSDDSVGWAQRHRTQLVEQGDKCLSDARRMTIWANAAGELPNAYWWDFWHFLKGAEERYRLAGLGLLAGRVAFMARRVAELRERENVYAAWAKFDRLNAGGGGVA